MTAKPADLSDVEKLAAHHVVRKFKSTEHSLNDWLRRHALRNQLVDSAQTYVVHRGGKVVAYYSLVYGHLALEICTGPVREGMPPAYPVPVMKIARLAVDQAEVRQGLGRALMKDAFVRTVTAAAIGGLRAVVVNALNEDAKTYYVRNFGFEESPADPLLLFLRIEDLRLASGVPVPMVRAGDTQDTLPPE